MLIRCVAASVSCAGEQKGNFAARKISRFQGLSPSIGRFNIEQAHLERPGRANPLDPSADQDRLNGKVMGGNPVFRGTRVPVHMLAELVPSPSGNACTRARYRRGSGAERSWLLSVYTPCKINAPPEAQEAVGRGQELSGGAPRADES